MSYKIGARNIKTSIAVLLCILISYFLGLNTFYITTAAIISMESSIVSSFNVGKNRLIGTGIGAIVGLILALIRPGSIILATIGIVIIIYICNILTLKKAVTIASIVFLSIILNWKEGTLWDYGIARIIDTFIGIFISMAVNFFIAPYNFEKSIYEQINDIKKDIRTIISNFICSNDPNIEENCKCQVEGECKPLKESIQEFHDKMSRLEAEIIMYSTEVKITKHSSDLTHIKSTLEIIKKIYAHLLVLDPIGGKRLIGKENIKKLSDLKFDVREQYGVEKTLEDNIYNYHLGIILEKVKELP